MKRLSLLLIGFLALLLVGNGLALAESRDLETMPESTSGSSFLESEAGITAYTNVDSVDLSQAKNAFKNIETETGEYLVGSVSIADYREKSDVHVYVDVAGWIAAYYLKEEPASKIIDWRQYNPSTGTNATTLERGIVSIADVLGTAIPYTKYCDFRFPDAGNIMIVTDEIVTREATETFKIKIPYEFTVYSRSWAHYGKSTSYAGHYARIKIDDNKVNEMMPESYPNKWKIAEGSLTSSQLTLGEYHTISTVSTSHYTSSYVGIAIIYSQ